MDKMHYREMLERLDRYEQKERLDGKIIYLFGHCEATLTLAETLLDKGYSIRGILDNSREKQGKEVDGIRITSPEDVLKTEMSDSVVLIVTRFYESMNAQLRDLGYEGEVQKLVDYNTYAEYSLSQDTMHRKMDRVRHGEEVIQKIRERHGDIFRIFCPFSALGDIYFCMSYLPHYCERQGISDFMMCVLSQGCAEVAGLFGAEHVEVLSQNDFDSAVQATIYTDDKNGFIAHQDRPYVVNLHKALHVRNIPLKKIYCCGIFGLDEGTEPVFPTEWRKFGQLDRICVGRAVILSPYAKSVTALSPGLWSEIIDDYRGRGYQIFTNVAADEEPLPWTEPISPSLAEMKSAVECAGTFIGIRSGLCDVIRTADCRKIALYPDYNYCDTKWKVIDMYALDEFENIVVGDGFKWKMN